MKTKFTALALAAVTALSLAPKPAMAGDKEVAIIGGFLGGLIVASAINDSRHDNTYNHHDTAVVVSGNDRCENRFDRCEDRREAGFWKEVTVQVWIPACWIVERQHHGRDYQRYVGGHYECRTNRVWVAYDRHDRHDNREMGFGYGHDRR